MKWIAIIICGMIGIVGGFFFYKIVVTKKGVIQNFDQVREKITEKPLDKYSFDSLRKSAPKASTISLGKVIKDDPDFTSFMFYYLVEGKKVSGLMNIPQKPGTYPVILMLRGYVDKDMYTPGEGTRRTGEYFAKNGFITLAPDFLGFGESEGLSGDSLQDRFQTYPTAVTLLQSIPNLNKTLAATKSGTIQVDPEKIGMWGHSNGGHIALSALAITEKPYPTVLWNPVSKLFPYSILYFTDEYDDHGKGLIRILADFQSEYDSEKYSTPNYYKYITAPIQLDQAVNDEAVPIKWSNELNQTLVDLKKEVTYTTYPGENHNFNNGSWETVVKKSSDFFRTHFQK